MNLKQQRQSKESERGSKAASDKNFIFFNILDSKYEEQRPGDERKFKHMLEDIKLKLLELEGSEKEEWSKTMELKCLQLRRCSKISELITNIRRLVFICNSLKICYNESLIQSMVKSIYYQKYGQQILPLFSKAGYGTEQYQFLSYSEPWYSRVFSFFSSD